MVLVANWWSRIAACVGSKGFLDHGLEVSKELYEMNLKNVLKLVTSRNSWRVESGKQQI
jgi:hypothetical protein